MLPSNRSTRMKLEWPSPLRWARRRTKVHTNSSPVSLGLDGQSFWRDPGVSRWMLFLFLHLFPFRCDLILAAASRFLLLHSFAPRSPSLTHRISHIAYSYIKGLFTSLFTIHPLYLSTSYRDWDNPSSLDSQTRIFNRLLAFFLTLAPLWKTSARV